MPATNYHAIGRNATKVRELDSFIVVTLYNTDVVKFNDDVIILNTGRFQTQTTKNENEPNK